MEKDFDGWNRVKKATHTQERTPFFHEREVWWTRIGVNIGHEQDGKGTQGLRPVIILKKFNNDTCLCIPLTKRVHISPFHFKFVLHGRVVNSAILSQIRLIDAKRLRYRLGTITEGDFVLMKKKLTRLLA